MSFSKVLSWVANALTMTEKKKDPPTWGKFKRLDKCKDCGYLQRESMNFLGACPECGSSDIKRVTARWRTECVPISLFLSKQEFVESEIRTEKNHE